MVFFLYCMASLAVGVRVDDGAFTLPNGETLAQTHGSVGMWYLVDGLSDVATEVPFVATLKGLVVGISNGADSLVHGSDSFLAQQNQRMARILKEDHDWYTRAYNVNLLAAAIHKGAFVKAFQAEPPTACYWANWFIMYFGSGANEEEPTAAGAASAAGHTVAGGVATEAAREMVTGAGEKILEGGLEYAGKFFTDAILGEIPSVGTIKSIIKNYFATRHLHQGNTLSGVTNAEAKDVAAQNADLDTGSETFCKGVDLTKPQGVLAEKLTSFSESWKFWKKKQDTAESKVNALTPDDQKDETYLASAFDALSK